MNIQLDEKYRIVSVEKNIILQEVKYRKTGKNIGTEFTENVGYYGSVRSCLKGYKELMIIESDATSINQLLKHVEEIDKKIDSILKDI